VISSTKKGEYLAKYSPVKNLYHFLAKIRSTLPHLEHLQSNQKPHGQCHNEGATPKNTPQWKRRWFLIILRPAIVLSKLGKLEKHEDS